MPGASKFAEMGIKARKEIETPEQTEKSARQNQIRCLREDNEERGKGNLKLKTWNLKLETNTENLKNMNITDINVSNCPQPQKLCKTMST